jgi:hypothetical protein
MDDFKTPQQNKRLVELHDRLIDDVKLTELNLHDRTLTCPAIKTKWLRMLFEERKLLKKLEEYKKTKVEEYIKTHGKPNVPKNVEKIQLDAEARKTADILRIDNAVENEKEVIDFLEQAIKVVMTSFSFDIKNSIDILKIENS